MANIKDGTRFELLSLRDVSWVTSGTNDPTLGEAAPQGSVFLRDATTQGELYLKTGPLDTDWTLLATGDNIQEVLQIFQDMKEPTGHVDRSESRILFDNGTRTFTIEPNTPTSTEFNYYIHGTKHTIATAKTLV